MLEKTTYANYRKLCEAMEIPFERGNSKVARIRSLEGLCKYYREGRAYVVEEIYPQPKVIIRAPEEISPHGLIHKYNQCTVPLFFSLFSGDKQRKQNQIIVSSPYLYNYLGFCNSNFGSHKSETHFLLKNPELNQIFHPTRQYLFREMWNSTSDTIGKYIKDGILKKEKAIRIVKNGTLSEPTIDESKLIEQFHKSTCKELEVSDIWEIKQNYIKSLKYDQAKQIFCSGKGWDGYYNRILYTLDPDRVLIHPFSDEKRQEMQKHVNDGFYERFLNHGEPKEILDALIKR